MRRKVRPQMPGAASWGEKGRKARSRRQAVTRRSGGRAEQRLFVESAAPALKQVSYTHMPCTTYTGPPLLLQLRGAERHPHPRPDGH